MNPTQIPLTTGGKKSRAIVRTGWGFEGVFIAKRVVAFKFTGYCRMAKFFPQNDVLASPGGPV